MTRTGPTDVVMPACGRAADGPVSVPTAFRAPGSVRRTPRASVAADPVFLRVAPVKHASGRLTGRCGRFRPASQRSRCPRVSEQHCSTSPAHRIYPHVLRRRAAALYGCSVAPGRDVLCTLSSPPWPQWP
jgi:hypothetical protein